MKIINLLLPFLLTSAIPLSATEELQDMGKSIESETKDPLTGEPSLPSSDTTMDESMEDMENKEAEASLSTGESSLNKAVAAMEEADKATSSSDLESALAPHEERHDEMKPENHEMKKNELNESSHNSLTLPDEMPLDPMTEHEGKPADEANHHEHMDHSVMADSMKKEECPDHEKVKENVLKAVMDAFEHQPK